MKPLVFYHHMFYSENPLTQSSAQPPYDNNGTLLGWTDHSN